MLKHGVSDGDRTRNPRSHSPRTADRFWQKVDMSGGPDACWPWIAAHDGHGYGMFAVENRRTLRAHAISLEIKIGRRLLRGEVTRHRCDNPPCVNPSHLDLGTYSDNLRDAWDRGRRQHQQRVRAARDWVLRAYADPVRRAVGS
jgi:hypothetical protein